MDLTLFLHDLHRSGQQVALKPRGLGCKNGRHELYDIGSAGGVVALDFQRIVLAQALHNVLFWTRSDLDWRRVLSRQNITAFLIKNTTTSK